MGMSDSEKSSLEHEFNFSQSSNETPEERRIGRTLERMEEEMEALEDTINDLSISSDQAIVPSSTASINTNPSSSLFIPISNENELPSKKSSKKTSNQSPMIRNRDQNLSTLLPSSIKMIEGELTLDRKKEKKKKKKKEIKKKKKKKKKK